jgi:hypothetical protein
VIACASGFCALTSRGQPSSSQKCGTWAVTTDLYSWTSHWPTAILPLQTPLYHCIDTIRRRPTQSRFVQNAPKSVCGNMAARRLQLFAQREWANELSSFSIQISGCNSRRRTVCWTCLLLPFRGDLVDTRTSLAFKLALILRDDEIPYGLHLRSIGSVLLSYHRRCQTCTIHAMES